MKAMVLERVVPQGPHGQHGQNGPKGPDAPMRPPETGPLLLKNVPEPEPSDGEILIRVRACGVCHTELDEIAGRTMPRLPVIPGHQVVGIVEAVAGSASGFRRGDRIGVGWIHSACGTCRSCHRGEENLCPGFVATGRDVDGGYAELMKVPEAFAHALPEGLADEQAAPLLCAGAIGWRSLRLTGLALRGGSGGLGRGGAAGRLGLTGFGASGHIVLKLVAGKFPGIETFVFARSPEERAFALDLGAAWAGETADAPPAPLDAVIDTTPAWRPPVRALEHLRPGGRLVINAIRKRDDDRDALAGIDYERDLWMEKEIKTVANVTRRDVRECLELATECGLIPEIEEYALEDANRALSDLASRRVRGGKVLKIS